MRGERVQGGGQFCRFRHVHHHIQQGELPPVLLPAVCKPSHVTLWMRALALSLPARVSRDGTCLYVQTADACGLYGHAVSRVARGAGLKGSKG